MRIGMGYDVHRLTEGRKLIMGGVEIPYERGLWGIPTRMCSFMPLWMHFWEQQRWEISVSISRIRTLLIKGFPPSGSWSMWEVYWKKICS